MGFWFNLAQFARFLFWMVLIALIGLQVFGGRDNTMQKRRDALIDQFQAERKSRVIALIHRQESQSILGVDVGKQIDIEDSEAILRAIRLTPDEQPIDLILHTPGGLVLAAEQIAKALVEHKGKVTVDMPLIVYSLMDLYPQSTTQRPSVISIPVKPIPAMPVTPAVVPVK